MTTMNLSQNTCMITLPLHFSILHGKGQEFTTSFALLNTLEPLYNTVFGVHSVISAITEYCCDEGFIHGKWKPSLNRVITEFVL